MADFELQYLQHGKSLCGRVFGTFVETFNRLVDFHANLKGDGDVSDDGLVTVDRADPAHPVIRLNRSKLPTDGGGGTSADLSASAFGLVEEKDDDGAVTGRTVVNCWWNAGGITMGDGGSFDVGAGDGVIYAEFSGDADGDGGGAMGSLSVSTCGGFSELNELQRDAAKYVFPLYLVSGGEVVDLRSAPQLQLFEEARS